MVLKIIDLFNKLHLQSLIKAHRLFVGLLLFTVVVSLYLNFSNSDWKYHIVASDGRGYYAYLPTLLIFNDPSYTETLQAEKDSYEHGIGQVYLNELDSNYVYNKYYPGVALLQLPFFVATYGTLKVMGKPVTGYSTAFLLSVWFGSLCYSILGLFFLYRSLLRYGGTIVHSVLTTAAVFFGTHLFFQALSLPSFSHNYSFFLFALLFFLTQRLIDKTTLKNTFLVGVTLGLIFLVRPTNILAVLFLPFFFNSGRDLGRFILRLFSLKNKLLLTLLTTSLAVASILFILYKWQTGKWVVWAYSGEGFDFLHPRIIETLFSYHIGIFVHTPLLILGIIGLVKMAKLIPYKALVWSVYFFILIYITSSWWCWDYASSFGHRALSEHMILFAFPILFLLEHTSRKKIVYLLITLFSLYIWMRAYQRQKLIFHIQKFTPVTFWKSFGDFDASTLGKYTSLEHSPPFGKIVNTTKLSLNEQEFTMIPTEAFSKSIIYHFPKGKTTSRFRVEAIFDKQLLGESVDWKDIHLVFDATNSLTNERIYYASGVYSYYMESQDKSEITIVSNDYTPGLNPMEQVVIYFWNPEGKHFRIQNFRIVVTEYNAD